MSDFAPVHLTEEDHKKLQNFVDLVSRLRQRRFVSENEFSKNNLFNIIHSSTDNQKPDEELLQSLVLDIRKLYMTKEETSFDKIFPVLMKYVDGEEMEDLKQCQTDYRENLNISFPAGIPVKEAKTIKNILDDWFYGHYAHEEKKKKETISQLGGAKDFYKWIFIENLGGLLEFAFALDDLAKKLFYRNRLNNNNAYSN